MSFEDAWVCPGWRTSTINVRQVGVMPAAGGRTPTLKRAEIGCGRGGQMYDLIVGKPEVTR